jgi:hypothetical protein
MASFTVVSSMRSTVLSMMVVVFLIAVENQGVFAAEAPAPGPISAAAGSLIPSLAVPAAVLTVLSFLAMRRV